MLNLKSFRESSLKMTQEQFANMIGIRQDTLSRMEKNPEQISLEIITKIAKKTGTTLDELINYEKPLTKPLETKYTWGSVDYVKNTLTNYIEDWFKQNTHNQQYKGLISKLNYDINNLIHKPKIALLGRSDVGKSALINSLLGTDKMITAWSPTTSIVVYIKHISDKPSFMNNDDVWFFKNSVNGQENWNDKYLYNEKYCNDWKVASGGTDLLKKYSTRFGNNDFEYEVGSAVLFLDSSILMNCDIMDLPGFGTGDRIQDDTMTLSAKNKADILIYLSISNGFMRNEDIQYLKESISSLNIIESEESNIIPLSNLFIIASQAHIVDKGNPESLKVILDKGCERFEKSLTPTFWKKRKKISNCTYDHEVLRSRFFTYTSDIEDLRTNFESSLTNIIELLPQIINKKVNLFINDFAKNQSEDLENAIKSYNSILNQKESYHNLLSQIIKNEPIRFNDNQNKRLKISSSIARYNQTSISDFSKKYNKIISVDNIVEIIKTKKIKKNKEDIQLLSSYINSCLEDEMDDILKSNSELLSKEINEYISKFENSCNTQKINLKHISFNAKQAFASGLAGLATFGGLAVWASTLGNLGAYIILAKGVSLLSAIGISVGGTAAAATAISAIGGPVVLAIALAVIASISVFKITSANWEQSIAKKLVSAYKKQNALIKFNTSIKNYWDDTKYAFDKASDSLESEWNLYVEKLKSLIENYNIQDINNKIVCAKDVKKFFENIPVL